MAFISHGGGGCHWQGVHKEDRVTSPPTLVYTVYPASSLVSVNNRNHDPIAWPN